MRVLDVVLNYRFVVRMQQLINDFKIVFNTEIPEKHIDIREGLRYIRPYNLSQASRALVARLIKAPVDTSVCVCVCVCPSSSLCLPLFHPLSVPLSLILSLSFSPPSSLCLSPLS